MHTPHARTAGLPSPRAGAQDAELALCAHCCAIPTGRAQPSMNLSHAAAVVLAQLFELRLSAGGGATTGVVEVDGAESAPAAAHVHASWPRRDHAC